MRERVPESIDVSPGVLTVAAGDSVTLAAIVRDELGESIEAAAVEWSSSDESVAMTTATGMVHGMSEGSAQIRARAGSVEGIAHVTVESVPAGNQAPVADITSPANDLTVSAGDTIHFRGTADDPDGSVASHTWSFGDGSSSSLEEPDGHVYGTAGTYQVTYQVTDDVGAPSPVVSRTVTVEALPGGNHAPAAEITSPAQDTTVSVGDTVLFRGSASDPDGSVASHAWSFGDGSSSSLEEPAGHVYGTAGTYQVTYQVTDDEGTPSLVASRTVTVEPLPGGNRAPAAEITSPAQDTTVSVGATVVFRGSASDPDGSVASHAWSFGDGSSSSLEEPAGHVYGTAGTYQVTYQVTDDEGATSPVASRTVTVEAAAPGRIVIFEDGFESGDLAAWDGFAAGKYSVTSNPDRVRSGNYALQSTVGEYGELNKWFMPGYSDVTVQFDVMFADGFQNQRSDGYGMHFFGVLGNRIDDAWSAHGQAGVLPDGTDFFVTVLDPVQYRWDPTLRPFFFYTNYPDMTCGGSCYGNPFTQSNPAADIVPGQWHRIEIRLKANTPGELDGAQELWVDGVQKINAQGMRWRDTDEVRVNEIAVWNYMPGSPAGQYIWIDNVIVTRPDGS